MEIDPIDFKMHSSSSETDNSSMEVSYESAATYFANKYDFNDSVRSSKLRSSNTDSTRSSESDINNSICFNSSILVMLQCEEKGNKIDLSKRFGKAKKRNIEPIDDLITIEYIDVKRVKTIVENNNTVDGLNYCIIDARFPFEFNGGHIRGAVNLFTPLDVFHYFFGPDQLKNQSDKDNLELVVSNIINLQKFSSDLNLIFHCEFSSARAPKMAEEFRCIDRFANLNCYPHLFYPKISILKGGYQAFYMKYKELCEPSGYRKMDLDDNLDTFVQGIEMPKPSNLDCDMDIMGIPIDNLEQQWKNIEFYRIQVKNQLEVLANIKQSIILQRKQDQSNMI